ncbi:TIGR02391 family protein [Aneurinibacillus terranovensis]|uniref:TIGR02391 family protein n=1 Tax=Aneurinibacillus terranovensis TaxID=278991 RepID=UPI0003FBE847|nr:TIGR02391 family protein [Aneurinibacillus terranovensis]
MVKSQKFSKNEIEAISKIIGDTSKGATGSEIIGLLAQLNVRVQNSNLTKWRMLNLSLNHIQDTQNSPANVIKFIELFIDPTRFVDDPDSFKEHKTNLNKVLLLSGREINNQGKIMPARKAETLDEASVRANELKHKLIHRSIHSHVLKFCEPEYLQQNYFHAVFEAVKSILERLRDITSIQEDGVKLVTTVFDEKRPKLSFNKFQTPSEQNELMGFRSLIVGLVKMIRNTHAHEAKLNWAIEEKDALDVLTMVSYVHRKLDESFRTYY